MTECTSHPLLGARLGRTRQLGGGANLWGGQLAVQHRLESAPTGDANAGWPFEVHLLARRASKAAALLGQEICLDLQSERALSPARQSLQSGGLELVTTAWLRTPKLPKSVWQELEQSTQICIATQAAVHRLSINESGETDGVFVRTADGKSVHVAGRPVILACGSIETVRLLLQPIPDRRAPWSTLYWLGRGFTEHLEAAVARVQTIRPQGLRDVFDPLLLAGVRYSCKTFGQIPTAEHGPERPLSVVGMLTMPGNIRNAFAELRMLVNGLTPRTAVGDPLRLGRAVYAASAQTLPLAWRYLKHKRIGTMFTGESTLRLSVEQPVRAASRITLSQQLDRQGLPRACVHWIKGQAEGQAFFEMTHRIKLWAERSGVAKLTIDPRLLDDPQAFAAVADEGLHHAGGTRMAASPEHGVVDSDLAVFGTRNLYCCGAATFPRLGYANPTLTAVALADRLAEHVSTRQT